MLNSNDICSSRFRSFISDSFSIEMFYFGFKILEIFAPSTKKASCVCAFSNIIYDPLDRLLYKLNSQQLWYNVNINKSTNETSLSCVVDTVLEIRLFRRRKTHKTCVLNLLIAEIGFWNTPLDPYRCTYANANVNKSIYRENQSKIQFF